MAGALLAFGSYVRTLSNELSGTMAQLEASLTRTSPADARSGGAFAGPACSGDGE